MKINYLLLLFMLWYSTMYANQKQNELNDNYLKGLASIEQMQYQEAISHLSKAHEELPLNTDIISLRGDCYIKTAAYDSALADFIKAEQMMPGRFLFEIAVCYALQNKKEQTITTLKKHLATNYRKPKNTIRSNAAFKNINESSEWHILWSKDWHNKYEMTISDAALALKKEKISEVFEIIDPLIKIKKNAHQAYYIRAMAFVLRMDYHQALRDLNRAIKIKKNNTDYYLQRAIVLQKLNRNKKALNDYNYLIDINPYQIKLYYNRGVVLRKLKKYDMAATDFSLYLNYLPNDIPALFETGKCFLGKDEHLEALIYLNKVLKQDQSKSAYFKARAETYFATKTYEYAIRDFGMALDLNPNDGDVYFKRGLTYIEIYDYKKACSDFKQAFQFGILEADDYVKLYCR